VIHWTKHKKTKSVFLGNTKGSNRFQAGLEEVSEHVFKLPPEGTRIDAQENGWQFGTAKIDMRIPRGDDGVTYLLKAPKKPEEIARVINEVQALGVDCILGVDTGGDVLKPVIGKPGRDQCMWDIVRRTGIPAVLLVVAPGVDGETGHEEMGDFIRARQQRRALLGVIDLEPLMPVFERLKNCYGRNRTPNLILRSWRGELPGPRPGWVTIPRHDKPAHLRETLRWALVFSG
jgi:hypothetical protein